MAVNCKLVAVTVACLVVLLRHPLAQTRVGPTPVGIPGRLINNFLFGRIILWLPLNSTFVKNCATSDRADQKFGGRVPKLRILFGEILSLLVT